MVETIIMNHNPVWGDMQTLLTSHFTLEERRLVLEKAQEENERQNTRDDPAQFMPKSQPDWDPD